MQDGENTNAYPPRTIRRAIQALLLVIALSAAAVTAHAQDTADEPDWESRLEQLEDIIRQQQADLQAQQEQLAEQYQLIRQLKAERDAAIGAASEPDAVDEAPVLAQQPAPADEVQAEEGSTKMSEGQRAAEIELARREMAGTARPDVNAQQTLYDPSSSTFDPNFPGAWHLPGTTAAMKIGGYVNLALVNNLDPLATRDRFIVGTIPPEGAEDPDATDGTTVTASQTRFNVEVREQTTTGTMRAFIEGDFEGDGDGFRLRHAYGQYAWLLAGKTWSAFANQAAQPEGVDFEGINGAVILRQSQLRIFPGIGKDRNLVVSLEDPRTDVANGVGSEGIWDLAVSVDSVPFGEFGAWNYKVGLLLRQLRGQYISPTDDNLAHGAPIDETFGWGLTTSGRIGLSRLTESDFLLWQLSYGEGIGRYLNDLGTVRGGDAVFSPDGELDALPVFAGYLSYQHLWGKRPRFLMDWSGILRSNFTVSWVDLDTYDYQPGDAYDRTWRASANLLYYPTQNVRLGAELLWGQRKNKDGTKGDATQLQFSARYNF